jgi:hypothetical protein
LASTNARLEKPGGISLIDSIGANIHDAEKAKQKTDLPHSTKYKHTTFSSCDRPGLCIHEQGVTLYSCLSVGKPVVEYTALTEAEGAKLQRARTAGAWATYLLGAFGKTLQKKLPATTLFSCQHEP